MKLRTLLIGASLPLLAATPVEGQFSTDLPGVPRASVPFRGGHQNRTAWTFSYVQQENTALAGTVATGDTRAVGGSLEFGQSFRIGSRWELGYDLGLLQGQFVQLPSAGAGGTFGGETDNVLGGSVLQSLRLGLKVRPLHSLSPEGYGYEAALGASFQPSLEPVFGMQVRGDSTQMGGLASSREEEPILFPAAPQTAQFAGMVSYRARRFLVDAALVYTQVAESENAFAAGDYSGFAPRVGAMYRLTRSIGLGASWWGGGIPPWSGQLGLAGVDEQKSSFSPFVSFGSKPESGVDLLLASPTGDFTESVRLYIRGRSTR